MKWKSSVYILSSCMFFWHNLNFQYEKHENGTHFSQMLFVYRIFHFYKVEKRQLIVTEKK